MNLNPKSADSSIKEIKQSTAPVLRPKSLRPKRGASYSSPRLIVTTMLLLFALVNLNTGLSLSLYMDTETSSANLLQAGEWDAQQNRILQNESVAISGLQTFSIVAGDQTDPPVDPPTDPPADPPVVISDSVTTIDEGTPPSDPPAVTITEGDTVITDPPADTSTPELPQ